MISYLSVIVLPLWNVLLTTQTSQRLKPPWSVCLMPLHTLELHSFFFVLGEASTPFRQLPVAMSWHLAQ
jgi:hypothetical protein